MEGFIENKSMDKHSVAATTVSYTHLKAGKGSDCAKSDYLGKGSCTDYRIGAFTVSYTHLDVYKRQVFKW